MATSVLEVLDRQSVKRELLLPIIFNKLGPGKPLITVSELKQSISHVPQINFNVKDWIEDLIQQLYRYMYLDRKAPTEEERDIHGGKTRYVYWSIRELPVKNTKFLNSCIEPKRTDELPTRGVIKGPLDDEEEKASSPTPEIIPPEIAIQISTTVIDSLPQMIEGIKALETGVNTTNDRLNAVENMLERIEAKLLEINGIQILQEERIKNRVAVIRSKHESLKGSKNE